MRGGAAWSRRKGAFHGGRIWVEAQAGPGTTLCFTLPILVDAPVAAPERAKELA